MGSKTPEEIRANYGDRDAAWLRANLWRFSVGWKRDEIQRMILEKEGPGEAIELARDSNLWAKRSAIIAVIAILAGALIAIAIALAD